MVKNEGNKVISYTDKDGNAMIAIRCTIADCIAWGGFGVCDDCNKVNEILYYIPEINDVYCEKCFEKYKNRSKWYVADTDIVFNNLINYIVIWGGLKYSKEEIDYINEFFMNHGHSELHIERFLEKYS